MQVEKKIRLAARWLGEFLREAAVLVLVFWPLDWYLGSRGNYGWAFVTSFWAAALLLGAGMWVGIMAEGSEKENA